MKNPNDPNSYRARYDRAKARLKSYYEKKLAKAKSLRVLDRQKVRSIYDEKKTKARKLRTNKIRTARSNYDKAKLKYLKLKQEYERRKA